MADKQTSPKVLISVIMGVYNQYNKEELEEAVSSILTQSFKSFEFIIYDDGSCQEVSKNIRQLSQWDDRIKIIGKDENKGLAFSLNECIYRAEGKYIARMDADDISHPERLKVQYEFLESHSEYQWCGCNTELFDENGTYGLRNMPMRPEYKDYLKFSPYVHPTVMYRREIFDEDNGYKVSKETLRCEDYELFMRFRRMGYRGYNIQQYLFKYRENKDSFRKRKFRYRINEARLRYRNFKAMDMLFPSGWIYVFRPVIGGLLPVGMVAWLKRKQSVLKEEYANETERMGDEAEGTLQENLKENTYIVGGTGKIHGTSQ